MSALENQDFVLLLMNCKKYQNKAAHQKSTWLQRLPTFLSKYYHVLGDPDLRSEFVFNDTDHILSVKCNDDYNSLPKKVILAYAAVQSRFNFLYIFKTDDDQMVENLKAFELIRTTLLHKLPHYGGNIIDVKQPYKSQYSRIHPELPEDLYVLPTKYCSGRFYFLSKEAVADLVDRKVLIYKEYLEDYAIGYHLKKSLKANMLFIDTSKIFKDFIL
jgi:hypothetical protein